MKIAQYHIAWTLSICVLALHVKIDPVCAEVKPNSIFSDNAVLQRGVAVPVCGTANDGDKITVEFAGQKVSTVAQGGQWRVLLQPTKANAAPQYVTEAAARGDLTLTVSANGTIQPTRAINIGSGYRTKTFKTLDV